MQPIESFKMKFYNPHTQEDIICQIDEAECTDYVEMMIKSKHSEPLEGFARLSYVEIKEEKSNSIIAVCVDFKNINEKIILDVYVALLETYTQRQGYGTMLFNAMLKYIEERVIASTGGEAILKSIRGELSFKDKKLENWKKSIPFYNNLAYLLKDRFCILFKDDTDNTIDSKLFESHVENGFFIFENVFY